MKTCIAKGLWSDEGPRPPDMFYPSERGQFDEHLAGAGVIVHADAPRVPLDGLAHKTYKRKPLDPCLQSATLREDAAKTATT